MKCLESLNILNTNNLFSYDVNLKSSEDEIPIQIETWNKSEEEGSNPETTNTNDDSITDLKNIIQKAKMYMIIEHSQEKNKLSEFIHDLNLNNKTLPKYISVSVKNDILNILFQKSSQRYSFKILSAFLKKELLNQEELLDCQKEYLLSLFLKLLKNVYNQQIKDEQDEINNKTEPETNNKTEDEIEPPPMVGGASLEKETNPEILYEVDNDDANTKQQITISKLHGLTNINILEYYALEKLLFFDIDIEKKTKLLEYFYTAYSDTEFTIGDEEISILNEIKTLNADTMQKVECKKLGKKGDILHKNEEFLQHIRKNNNDVIELFSKLINVKIGLSEPFYQLFQNYRNYIDPNVDQPSEENVPFNSYMTIILSTILDFKHDFPFIPGQETMDDLLVNKLSETEIDLCEMEKTKYIFHEKSPLIYTQWVQIIIKYIIDGEMIGDMNNLNESKDIKKEREKWEENKRYIFKIINTIITNSDEQNIYKGKIFTSESIKKIIINNEKIMDELTKTIKDILDSLDGKLDTFKKNRKGYQSFIKKEMNILIAHLRLMVVRNQLVVFLLLSLQKQ